MKEATLVIIKPDGLHRSLTGNILTRLSETRLFIVGAKAVKVSKELAEEHYRHMRKASFFNALIDYIMGKAHNTRRVLCLAYYGEDAIRKVRRITGSTNPEEADPVSIRGAYGRITTKGLYENVVHASSSQSEAEREIKLWFKPDEIVVTLYKTKLVVQESSKLRCWDNKNK
ncbi:MAG: nucleoside-diphosphate kinase [Candidatus Omnitrophica bacterium]|nr:nucleoside-diphosphate kinase [Candidatus Omnitrophota bacterium]